MRLHFENTKPAPDTHEVRLSVTMTPWSSYRKALLAAIITIAAFVAWMGLVMTDLPDTPTNIQASPMSTATPIDRGEQN